MTKTTRTFPRKTDGIVAVTANDTGQPEYFCTRTKLYRVVQTDMMSGTVTVAEVPLLEEVDAPDE